MRFLVPAATVLFLLAPPLHAGEPVEPIDLKGAKLTVTPPAGESWQRRVDADRPGQWVVTYQRGDLVLQAAAFPVRDGVPRDPRKLLFQLLRTTLPTVGVESRVGTPSLEAITVLGHPGAEATVSARRRGRLHGGRARLLETGGFFGFAWGLLPTGATARDRAIVDGFVKSMTPKLPVFFTPRFYDPDRRDEVLLRPIGEDPIRFIDLLAMERLTEISTGGPMCLSRRELMRQVLLEEATHGEPRFRDGVRMAAKAFEPSAEMTEAKQRAAQEKLATSIFHGFMRRWIAKDERARAYKQVRDDSTRILAGKPPHALRTRDLDNLMEMFGFLASIASDGPREVSVEQREAFLDARIQAWPDASEETRRAWTTAGGDWLRLRCAWDRADDTQRVAFRKAVRRALGAPVEAKALEAVKGPFALKRFMDEHGPVDMDRVLALAAEMSAARRLALLTTLPTWPASVPLGW